MGTAGKDDRKVVYRLKARRVLSVKAGKWSTINWRPGTRHGSLEFNSVAAMGLSQLFCRASMGLCVCVCVDMFVCV